MKFFLQYSNKIKQIAYSFALFYGYVLIDVFVAAAVDILVALFVIICIIMPLNLTQGMPIIEILFQLIILAEAVTIICVEIKRRKPYIKLTPKGVHICNSNGVHFGLGQWYRMNAVVPYNRIVSCKSGIPVGCPPNYRYQQHLIIYLPKIMQRHFALKRGKDVPYMKEPAIAGGRYDEECILLELDNKRIIVIPIDECAEFLDLFNQYFEQYKALKDKKEENI